MADTVSGTSSSPEPTEQAAGEDELFLSYYEHRFDYHAYVQSRLREEKTEGARVPHGI